MDVEQIQKINNLAVDLMKQGLAQNREEAISQAEKIFRQQDAEDYNSMKETLEAVQPETRQEPVVQENTETASPKLSENEIKSILEQNTKFLVKTIQTFQEKIVSLEKEMSSLKNELRYQNLPTVNSIVNNKEVPPIEEATEVPPPAEIQNSNESVPDNHPRVGSFNNDDVSIEKFFYMGNK